jgi:hypothetical protein
MADMLHSIAADRVLVVTMNNGLNVDHTSLHDTTVVYVEEGLLVTLINLNIEMLSNQLTLYNSTTTSDPQRWTLCDHPLVHLHVLLCLIFLGDPFHRFMNGLDDIQTQLIKAHVRPRIEHAQM